MRAEAELIARARHDREAFGEIYDLYVHRIYAFCGSGWTNRACFRRRPGRL